MKRRAFTLIELLIVVAIIAILAAIAVPNFLEAQVRAKISRSRADTRTFATAVESYAVDYTRPPLGEWTFAANSCKGCVSNPIPPGGPLDARSQQQLTTPVAYLNGFLQDPFKDKGDVNMKNRTQSNNRIYRYTDFEFPAKYLQPTYPNAGFPVSYFKLGYLWSVYGLGPQRNAAGAIQNLLAGMSFVAGQTWCAYDPSNGTVSDGWIIRTNKGVYTGQIGS